MVSVENITDGDDVARYSLVSGMDFYYGTIDGDSKMMILDSEGNELEPGNLSDELAQALLGHRLKELENVDHGTI